MINTITSPNGGVFTVTVDGFDTGSKIDTYIAPGASFLTCFPVQFPPFISAPPDFGSRNDHTITLTFIGASHDAPEGIISNIQFDSFAIPNHDSASRLSSNGCKVIGLVNLQVVFFLAVLAMLRALWCVDIERFNT